MTRARDLANIADGTFTATDLDLSGTLTVSGDANFDSGTLFVDVSANNVGIGTSSPSEQLHIANANDAVILVESTGIDATDDANIQLKTTNGTFTVQNDRSIGTSGALTFAGNTSNNIVIDHNSGNVGIGTSSPTTKLTVASATFEDHILVERTGVGSMHITATNPRGLAFTDGTTQFVTLAQSTGNVGIGTSSPVGSGTALNVRGPSAGLTIGSVVAESYDGVGHITLYSGIGGTDLPSIVYPSIGLRFGTGSKTTSSYAEKMRIDSSGNLLVGTTSALSFASGTTAGVMLEPNTLVASRANEAPLYLQRSGSDGGIAFFYKGTSSVGSINVTTSATSYVTSSDARLKENIVSAPSASEDIDAITVRSFDWKVDGSHQKYGMVAQELLEVAPEAVYQPDDPEAMMGVDYSKLVPMLVKEIQSLRARVAQLEGA